MVFCAAINCRNDSKSKVSTFKFPDDPKLRKQWLIKMKRASFEPTKHSRICADHFTADCFQQNLAIRTSLGSTFKPRRINWSGSKCRIFKCRGNLRLQVSNLSHCFKRTLNGMKNFGGTLETCTELFNWDFKYDANLQHENEALEQRPL